MKAYAKGVKTLPLEFANHPSVTGAAAPVAAPLNLGNSSISSSLGTSVNANGEHMQSFTDLPDKRGHSFEVSFHSPFYVFNKVQFVFAGTPCCVSIRTQRANFR